jgi:LmbE family N-acetylglucosaminyl deacetylase
MRKRILVVAPHPDDETLGAGGTIAKYAAEGHEVFVLMVSGHLPPLYPRDQYDTTVAEASCAFEILGVSRSRFLEIPATRIGDEPVDVLNGHISHAVQEFAPHIVLGPFPDRHIDHRLIFDGVMVAARPVGAGRAIEMLAVYETLSETHWNAAGIEPAFAPTWVVNITAELEHKVRALECYTSQIPPFPGARSVEAVRALAAFRGTQAGFAAGEAFQIVRMVG